MVKGVKFAEKGKKEFLRTGKISKSGRNVRGKRTSRTKICAY